MLGTKAPTAKVENTSIVTNMERKRSGNIGKSKPYDYKNSKKGYKASSKIITESEYWDKYEEIKNTGKIEHKTLGKGVVKRFQGTQLKLNLKIKQAK